MAFPANFFASNITSAEVTVDHTFDNKELVLEALLAPGCAVPIAGSRRCPDGNRRLALVGDSVLRLILVMDGYNRSEPRGDIQDTVSRIAENKNLANVGMDAGLDLFIVKNKSQGGVVNTKTMTATVEALIGAAFLDGGLGAARLVMLNLGLKQAT